jgi:hypothetical protein
VNSSTVRATLFSVALAIGWVSSSVAARVEDGALAPSHLLVEPPLAGPLTMGLAVILFQVENIKIVPKYGEPALAVTPRIGHLHIAVDGAFWHWVHATDEPIIIQGLPTGAHRVLLELTDANHRVLDAKTINFDIQDQPHAH